MPAAQITRKTIALTGKPCCQAVGLMHALPSFAAYFGGCRLEIAAVTINIVIP
uniref:Uncharacterized protein n=1 Tax=Rhizophora mucronata TaxID=61149 RepID=A0A2P2R2I0_RHIMU